MVENPITKDDSPRLSYQSWQDIQALYHKKPLPFPAKPHFKETKTNENR